MLDIPVRLDKALYAFLRDLLEKGKAEYNDIELDMSDTQDMSFKGSKLAFNPPLRLRIKKGLLDMTVRITGASNLRNGIHFNVENSPIDIKVLPDA